MKGQEQKCPLTYSVVKISGPAGIELFLTFLEGCLFFSIPDWLIRKHHSSGIKRQRPPFSAVRRSNFLQFFEYCCSQGFNLSLKGEYGLVHLLHFLHVLGRKWMIQGLGIGQTCCPCDNTCSYFHDSQEGQDLNCLFIMSVIYWVQEQKC